MMDKITIYRTKIAWIRKLLSTNENKELHKVWDKYALIRKILESVELDLNSLQIMESVEGIKTKNYKIRANRVAKELEQLTSNYKTVSK